MKKLLVLALSIGLLVWGLGVGTSSADAACGVKCLSKQVKKLKSQVGSLNAQVQSLSAANACIRTTPVTQYFGYEFGGTIFTTALDFTDPGDSVSIQMLGIPPGTCGTSTSRTASASRATGGFQPLQPDTSLQTKD
jgi:hypothetical protein